jgi:hypothetical protein
MAKEIPKEAIHMAKFCVAVIRLAREYPEYEGLAKKAMAAVKRAQLQMIEGRPSRWRASRPVKRLVREVWERFGIRPY